MSTSKTEPRYSAAYEIPTADPQKCPAPRCHGKLIALYNPVLKRVVGYRCTGKEHHVYPNMRNLR